MLEHNVLWIRVRLRFQSLDSYSNPQETMNGFTHQIDILNSIVSLIVFYATEF